LLSRPERARMPEMKKARWGRRKAAAVRWGRGEAHEGIAGECSAMHRDVKAEGRKKPNRILSVIEGERLEWVGLKVRIGIVCQPLG